MKTNEDDFFAREDPAWGQAFEILCEGCEIPPSLEGFEHSLEMARARSRAPISVQQHARTLSDSYRRIR